MRRNLVLGGEGFIGKPLCEYLRGLGEDVVSVDFEGCDVVGHDLRDPDNLPWMGDGVFDAVYFLAWDVGGAKWLCGQDAQVSQCINNTAMMNVVLTMLTWTGVPFVFASSRLATEDTVYGVQKRLGELWTDQLPNGKYVRLYNVYGAYEEVSERSHVVADFIHQALDTGKIKMIGDGSEMRDFVHIDEVCIHLALAANGADTRRDCRSGIETSIGEMARIILGIVNDGQVYGDDWMGIEYYVQQTVQLFKERKGIA